MLAALFTALALPLLSLAAPIVERANAHAAPHQVIYLDNWVNQGAPPAAADLGGFNTVVLSFWLTSGAADMAQGWASLDAATKKSIKADYKKNDINLLVSAFGSTDLPVSQGKDAKSTADALAKFVTAQSLDGVDVDFEDLDAMNQGKAEAWLIAFTKELHAKLPAGSIITHAPLAPWFTNNGQYPNGAYNKINKQVGSLINWYNIQFYNQNDYETCDSLVTKSTSSFTGTALMQIINGGVPSNKAVLGKPATSADASNGFVALQTLAKCVKQAKAKNWKGGLSFWQYHGTDQKSLVKTVWGSA